MAYLPTFTASIDGILCSFLNPVGTVNQTPRTLYITGVRIQSIVTTALTGGPCVMLYSLAFGHTALSLATAETGSFVTASAKAPRRIALGMESFASAAPLGSVSSTNFPVQMTFASPIVINPAEVSCNCSKERRHGYNIGCDHGGSHLRRLRRVDASSFLK